MWHWPPQISAATHAFYTEAMGFELVKAVAAPTDDPGGWAKHVFYDTGGDGMIAFWDLHDPRIPTVEPVASPRDSDFRSGSTTSPSTPMTSSISLPHEQRWLDQGIDVMEIDHGFCVSVYCTDPNGILVEWCTDTAPYTEADKARALAVLLAEEPELESPPTPVFHRGKRRTDRAVSPDEVREPAVVDAG